MSVSPLHYPPINRWRNLDVATFLTIMRILPCINSDLTFSLTKILFGAIAFPMMSLFLTFFFVSIRDCLSLPWPDQP